MSLLWFWFISIAVAYGFGCLIGYSKAKEEATTLMRQVREMLREGVGGRDS